MHQYGFGIDNHLYFKRVIGKHNSNFVMPGFHGHSQLWLFLLLELNGHLLKEV